VSVGPPTIRVMTWNLWWRFGPWEQRQAAIRDEIVHQQPDVLMLQEVWRSVDGSLAEWLAAECGYHGAETSADDAPTPHAERHAIGFHNALLSRWPLEQISTVALPGADDEPGHRRLLLADTATPWGRWPLACTHLDYRFDQSAARQRQAVAVLEAVAARRGDPDTDLPMLLGADLNAVPDSDEVRMLTGRSAVPIRNLVLSDAWEHVGAGEGFTWRADNPHRADTAWPNRRIDYVMVSWPRPKPVGNPVAAWLAGLDERHGVMPSDHAAVVVDIRSPGGG
jgi:endonuclease/exonuclease/phosphatase family metal-dependent hydrolase